MLDAVVGAVIMLIATTSLLSAVEGIETVFAQAGRQELTVAEEQMLERIGKSENESLQFWQDSISNLPRDVVSSSP